MYAFIKFSHEKIQVEIHADTQTCVYTHADTLFSQFTK